MGEEVKELIRLLQQQQQQIVTLLAQSSHSSAAGPGLPAFEPFDPTSELWKDYTSRFQTFSGAHSVPDTKLAQVFLTNQSTTTYKLLSTLAAQQTPPKSINDLDFKEITDFMESQFDPRRFTVRERYKFWSDMNRKPGESVQELAARIREDAAKCDFTSIKDPQDEAMRTRFVCCVNNEAVLKALFKVKDDELTFAKAIQVAQETEDAAQVARETVHSSKKEPVLKVSPKTSGSTSHGKPQKRGRTFNFPPGTCPRCGQTSHKASTCRFKDEECRFCHKKGHIAAVCLRKKAASSVGHISAKPVVKVNHVSCRDPLLQPLFLHGQKFVFQADTGSPDNFCSTDVWTRLGKPKLQPPHSRYVAATGKPLPVLGIFYVKAKLDGNSTQSGHIELNVSKCPLNLLGRAGIDTLRIDLNSLFARVQSPKRSPSPDGRVCTVEPEQPDKALQKACLGLCKEFPDLFKEELGCLKNFELELKFKPDVKPVFIKPRTVPLALLDDLNAAYDAGIRKGVWEPTQFNDWGTPVVPVRKPPAPGQTKGELRVCGDYSVTVNPQLEDHRHPLPLPDDLMRKLGGGYFFSKVDLASAYNQIKLGPESQKRLALSTHRGVLLQKRLAFGPKPAVGHFQEIMDQLTRPLRGTAAFLDDFLVSGTDAQDHLENLRALFQVLQDNGLRCNLKKCSFAQPSIEYLGHTLSREGVAKGSKVDAVLRMPPPTDVSTLRSFLGSVQFYSKFIPDLSTLTEPLTRLTRKDTPWTWGTEQQASFQRLKDLLTSDTILAHYDPSQEIGISTDASEVGIGAVLFHRYADGSERPIANASKTLNSAQRRYSQVQKEALGVIFGLKKFHHFLFGRRFILITDSKPLVAMFSPTKGVPIMAANRLARWALTLSQYDYTVEYRATKDHGNADALSRLPAGKDAIFDGEEGRDDANTVCFLEGFSRQLDPVDPRLVSKESGKDPTISAVMRYVKEGWPNVLADNFKPYKKLIDSLSTESGCLFVGARIVVPERLRPQVLDLLHLGHFGMQRMKQLARSVVYWPHINDDIEQLSRLCSACQEHQNKPPKPANHPWMLPEKPWSRVHVDHAINFLGSNWLVAVDAYSKYPCIHPTTSTTAKAAMDLLEEDFAHFGYPHTLVTDNATTFLSEEFQAWCKERGITHLSGAPYHPATNGAAERLVQSFKQSLRKSKLPPKSALREFLMQYRRTPLDSGYSPSELLNGRQLRCKLDALVPSPAHVAQGRQAKEAARSQREETGHLVSPVTYTYAVGAPCYALYCGPKRNKDPRWVPAVVTKVYGSRSVNVRVFPRGPTWRRHIEQLRPRHPSAEDAEPGEAPDVSTPMASAAPAPLPLVPTKPSVREKPKRRNWRLPTDDRFGFSNPRRSERLAKNLGDASGRPSAGGEVLWTNRHCTINAEDIRELSMPLPVDQ